MKKENKKLNSIKKLTLNKKAIAKLNSKEMNSIVGGATTDPTTRGCATACDPTDTFGCCAAL
ncbi:natural product precursor [Hydrobacter penzbergensis]|uniref:Natural product n=1 Tax=Hydrobacter penzbergensis TaxID=1235997 RepID=A0A8X8ICV9_9BACT|nr:class I lanthipeptide [Hydrobacter penzbergensis]SDX01054.1 natural product precursor [Hydrobacter penzbergensis]